MGADATTEVNERKHWQSQWHQATACIFSSLSQYIGGICYDDTCRPVKRYGLDRTGFFIPAILRVKT